jgi:hypothetical protein
MTTKRGRQMVLSDGKAFPRVQWENWSPPGWFSDADFERTAKSFENPDWPKITYHSYSVRSASALAAQEAGGINVRATIERSISAETLRRLEDEQREFKAFLEKLRLAKDRAELDQFLKERNRRSQS